MDIRRLACSRPGLPTSDSTDDSSFLLHVVPEDEPVQIVAGGEDHPATRHLGQSMGEGDVLGVLTPAGNEKEIDGDVVLGATMGFAIVASSVSGSGG